MADDITRWSDELARDPSSRVFLQLGDALRRGGQLDVAFKIAVRGLERHPHDAEAHDLVARIAADRGDLARAGDEWAEVLRVSPHHLGAMKGLGFVRFQQGRLGEAEQYLAEAAARGGGDDVNVALATVRRAPGHAKPQAAPSEPAPAAPPEKPQGAGSDKVQAPVSDGDGDPRRLFADLLIDDGQTALLLDAEGLVLGGIYVDPDGVDVGQDVGAQLSGISDEVRRSMRHLDLGAWSSIVFETQAAGVAMAPAPGDALLIVAATRATPLGLLRRLLGRCVDRATKWMGDRQ